MATSIKVCHFSQSLCIINDNESWVCHDKFSSCLIRTMIRLNQQAISDINAKGQTRQVVQHLMWVWGLSRAQCAHTQPAGVLVNKPGGGLFKNLCNEYIVMTDTDSLAQLAERRSLAGKLTLSCAWPSANGWPLSG